MSAENSLGSLEKMFFGLHVKLPDNPQRQEPVTLHRDPGKTQTPELPSQPAVEQIDPFDIRLSRRRLSGRDWEMMGKFIGTEIRIEEIATNNRLTIESMGDALRALSSDVWHGIGKSTGKAPVPHMSWQISLKR